MNRLAPDIGLWYHRYYNLLGMVSPEGITLKLDI